MKIITHIPCNDTNATLTGYLHEPIQEMSPRREAYPAVVVCPGGGYEIVSDREADPVALCYLAAGYQVFILYYSTCENAQNFTPLRELSESIAWIRENSKDLAVVPNQIAVCGFSAGGHLVASSGVLWNHPDFYEIAGDFKGKNRPDAMILSYAVITAQGRAHSGSIQNVSGATPGSDVYNFFSLEQHVGTHTPPAFFWHTVTDNVVPVENALAMINAMQKNHISYEAHLFPEGQHGLSVCTQEVGCLDSYNGRWMELSIAWLNRTFNYKP